MGASGSRQGISVWLPTMISRTMVSICANIRPRRTVLVDGSALTRSVVINQTHHRTEKMTTVLRAVSHVGSTERPWENTMMAATITRS